MDIDDALLRELKKKAAAELAGWRAEFRPGVDLFDRDRLLDLMDGR